MKTFVFVCLIVAGSFLTGRAADAQTRPDTTRPKLTSRRPVQAILPGYSLDTSFTSLARPDPAVYQVVPDWLRTQAPGKPVYVIDGQTANVGQLKGLRAEAVASVQVIEGEQAAALYGFMAREGVVAITTKAALQPRK